MFNMMGQGGGGLFGMGNQQVDQNAPQCDTSEQIYISPLSLLKMLKHARSGVPLEVMGLMLGEFIDDYTIKVVDVFELPVLASAVSVEAVDPIYQSQMLDLLKQTQRNEMVVGWYHSHPGYGPWLSNVDVNTQHSFEQLNPKAVAVVIDPVQSVRGKVVIDAFRLINPSVMLTGQEPRQTTGNLGHIQPPNLEALYKGLNKLYYNIPINFRTNDLEKKTMANLYKQSWTSAMKLDKQEDSAEKNVKQMEELVRLAKLYKAKIQEEIIINDDAKLKIQNTGKLDPKRHLQTNVEEMNTYNTVNVLGMGLNTKEF